MRLFIGLEKQVDDAVTYAIALLKLEGIYLEREASIENMVAYKLSAPSSYSHQALMANVIERLQPCKSVTSYHIDFDPYQEVNKALENLISSPLVEIWGEEVFQDDLFYAAITGNLKKVVDFVNQGADLETTLFGETPLAIALRQAYRDIAIYLIVHGAYIHIKMQLNMTPMKHALMASDVQLIRLLIEHGADVNESVDVLVPSIKGDIAGTRTPLSATIIFNDYETFTLILEKGVDLELYSHYLALAKTYERPQMIHSLEKSMSVYINSHPKNYALMMYSAESNRIALPAEDTKDEININNWSLK